MAQKTKSKWGVYPFDFSKGEWKGGDRGRIPEGYAYSLRNHVLRDGVWEARPPFTYDNLTAIQGLAEWYDETNGVRRMLALKSDGAVYAKNASGETWSASLGTSAASQVILDSFSYRGTAYFLVGSSTTRVPSGVYSYNGSSIASIDLTAGHGSAGTGDSDFLPRCAAVYKERAYYAGVDISVNNVMPDQCYSADGGFWNRTNIVSTTSTEGSMVVERIRPTDATTANMVMYGASAGSGFASGDHVATWAGYLRSENATATMPLTLALLYFAPWTDATAYLAGNIATPGTRNGYRYECITAGTSGGVEPVWPTTLNNTIADGTVTWRCVGSDVGASFNMNLPRSTTTSDFLPFTVTARCSVGENSSFTPKLTFGNTTSATYPLTTVVYALKDGRSDGDPRKRNYGHQLTQGQCALPFVNRDAATGSVTPSPNDTIFIADVANPELVRGVLYYRFRDIPGDVTALKVAWGKLIAFKTQGYVVLGAVNDPNIVVLPEGDSRPGYGCLNPDAAKVGPDGALYFIDGNEFYRLKEPDGIPEPLCGDAMRAEVFNKSASSWVESQSAPANRALLAINYADRECLLYTQKGKIYAYDIDNQAWSTLDVGGGSSTAPVGYQICAMRYNHNTGSMEFAFTTAAAGTAGVARLDKTQAAAADSISNSGTVTAYIEPWFRPVEMSGPRYELLIDSIRIHHKITASQSGQTFTPYYSRDQGITWTAMTAISIPTLSSGEYRPIEIPIFQSWGTIMLRLEHAGSAGAANWAISTAEAEIKVLSGEFQKDRV